MLDVRRGDPGWNADSAAAEGNSCPGDDTCAERSQAAGWPVHAGRAAKRHSASSCAALDTARPSEGDATFGSAGYSIVDTARDTGGSTDVSNAANSCAPGGGNTSSGQPDTARFIAGGRNPSGSATRSDSVVASE